MSDRKSSQSISTSRVSREALRRDRTCSSRSRIMSSLENPEYVGLADPQRLEVHLHALPRVMTQLIERVLLHTEPLRDLRVWHPFELGHEDRAPLLRQFPRDDVRERAQDALAHRAPLLRRRHPRLEHERRTRPLEHRVEGDVPPPLVTEVVEGDAHGDRERPGGEPALPSEPTEPLATRRSASCAKSLQRFSSAPRAVSTPMSPVTRTSPQSRRAASPSAPSAAI